VGREIIDQGLVKVAAHWQEAAHLLLGQLGSPPSKAAVKESITHYVEARRGGSRRACRLISQWLDIQRKPGRTLAHE
jgi:hypothetical protein